MPLRARAILYLAAMSDLTARPSIKPPVRYEVRGKLRAAIYQMVWEGLEWADAANKVGLRAQSMRAAFERPHVLAFIRKEREMLRQSLAPRNIHRLREIRDAADNMPAVNSIALLERMGADGSMQQFGATHGPGVTIIIGAVQTDERQPVKTTIDLKANPPDPDEPA